MVIADDPAHSTAQRSATCWSPTSSYYGWEYGLHTPEQFIAMRDAFAASPLWNVIFSEGGSVLFQYTGS